MNGKSHQVTSGKAMSLYHMLFPSSSYVLAQQDRIIRKCLETDSLLDLEIVDVDCGPDDPHVDRFADQDDEATYHFPDGTSSCTAFNHFMDIGKGQGYYDDFDGYSYRRGAASQAQYQKAGDVLSGLEAFAEELLVDGYVDESLMWYWDDEYVHCKAHQWYRPNRDLSGNGLGCSPSTIRYSRFNEQMGKLSYQTLEDELLSRFPFGKEGLNESVFMPVDNLGLWWYKNTGITFQNKSRKEVQSLGHVLHAIQDASIPHHAAGYFGNFHKNYEQSLDRFIERIIDHPSLDNFILALMEGWSKELDVNSPDLNLQNYKNYTPALGWNVDTLITWVALNAYDVYTNVYNSFYCQRSPFDTIIPTSCNFINRKGEFAIDSDSLKDLTIKAVSMSVFILRKAHVELGLNWP